ncbi:UNVERIFIED_CONTAM: hypothetical protein RKD43_006579 [Streptomyces graminofaciens]
MRTRAAAAYGSGSSGTGRNVSPASSCDAAAAG